MFPGYQYMTSSPQQGNGEADPSRTMIDPSKYANYYGSYPYGGYYGHLAPWNTCCHHNGFPGYAGFRPPCYHPPSPNFCCASYNFYPQGCPVQCFPPPYYTMELPGYEYNRAMPKEYHCCGCPHQKFNLKQEQSLRTEEKEPGSWNSRSQSLVPVEPKSFPDPVAWVPEQYTNGKESKMPVEQSKLTREEVNSVNRKHPENYIDRDPKELKGWLPLDLNSLKSLMRKGDTTKSQGHENEKCREFPFPNLWMPSYGDQEVAQKTHGMPVQSAIMPFGCSVGRPESLSSHSAVNRFNPIEGSSADENTNSCMSTKESSSSSSNSNVTNKNSAMKDIPVKGLEVDKQEAREEKRVDRDAIAVRTEDNSLGRTSSSEGDVRDAARKQSKDDLASKSIDNSKRQSKPQPKSKLPPVCLRLDPLPKKKANNGSPPSLSDHKGRLNGKSEASSPSGTEVDYRGLKPGCAAKNKEEGLEKEKKTIHFMENIPNRQEEDQCGTPVKDIQYMKEAATLNNKGKTENKDASTHSGSRNDETKGVSVYCESADSVQKDGEKRLSDEQAAVLIQSAYRGFGVRRREPLKKFKQIVELREQSEEVRKQIEALASSSGHQKNDKKGLATGEKIMRLLLELDEIQDLHPNLRDVRKSLARELVTLQEKLDSLMLGDSKTEPGQDVSTARVAEDDGANFHKELSTKSGELNDAGRVGVDEYKEFKEIGGLKVDKSGDSHAIAVSQGENDVKISNASDSTAVSQGEVASNSLSVNKQSYNESDNVTILEQVTCDKEHKLPETNVVVEPNEMQAVEQHCLSKHATSEIQESANKEFEAEQEHEFPSGEDLQSSAQLESSEHPSGQVYSDPFEKERANLPNDVVPALVEMGDELPIGVVDDDASYDLNKDTEADLEKHNRMYDMKLKNEGSTQVSQHASILAELPNCVDTAPPVADSAECTQAGNINDSNVTGICTVLSEEETMAGKRPEKADGRELSVDLETHPLVGQQGKEIPIENDESETKRSDEREVNSSDYYCTSALDQESEKSTILQMENKTDGELLETSPSGNKQPSGTVQEPVSGSMKASDFSAWDENTGDANFVSEIRAGLHEASSLIKQESVSSGLKDDINKELCIHSPSDKACELKTSKSCNASETADKKATVAGDFNLWPSEHEEEMNDPAPNSAMKVAAGDDQMLAEENSKLKRMVEKLLESKRSQLDVISNLNGRVKDLEKKLLKRRHLKTKRSKRTQCGRKVNAGIEGYDRERSVDVTM